MDLNLDIKKSCCFSGHRKIEPKKELDIKTCLLNLIMDLAEEGYEYYYCGCAVGFDLMCAETVISLKSEYPIKLVAVIPCDNQSASWSANDRETYDKVIRSADYVVQTGNEPTAENMRKRNRYLVDNTDFCIAYCKQLHTGTAYTLRYAKRHNKKIINVYNIIEYYRLQESLF